MLSWTNKVNRLRTSSEFSVERSTTYCEQNADASETGVEIRENSAGGMADASPVNSCQHTAKITRWYGGSTRGIVWLRRTAKQLPRRRLVSRSVRNDGCMYDGLFIIRGGAGRGGGSRGPDPLSPDQGHLWEAPRFDEFFGGWGVEGGRGKLKLTHPAARSLR